jgi:hypothetical protein
MPRRSKLPASLLGHKTTKVVSLFFSPYSNRSFSGCPSIYLKVNAGDNARDGKSSGSWPGLASPQIEQIERINADRKSACICRISPIGGEIQGKT